MTTQIQHVHRCGRCGIDFKCRNEGVCTAEFQVLPIIIENGVVVEHCPRTPDWNWIREYGSRLVVQVNNYAQYDGPVCWTEIPASDRGTWHCRKAYGHSGSHSPRNDCGLSSGVDKTVCGLPPDHAGRHAWETAA